MTEQKTKDSKLLFRPVEITDPLTGKKRVISAEEQEELLEKGVFSFLHNR